jgi:hypothetical protein
MYPKSLPIEIPKRKNENAPEIVWNCSVTKPDKTKLTFRTRRIGTQTEPWVKPQEKQEEKH